MLNFVFLTISLSTTSSNLFKSTLTVSNLTTSKSSTFLFILFKLVGTLTNSLISRLSTSVFKTTKSFLAAKSDVSTPISSSNYFLAA